MTHQTLDFRVDDPMNKTNTKPPVFHTGQMFTIFKISVYCLTIEKNDSHYFTVL